MRRREKTHAEAAGAALEASDWAVTPPDGVSKTLAGLGTVRGRDKSPLEPGRATRKRVELSQRPFFKSLAPTAALLSSLFLSHLAPFSARRAGPPGDEAAVGQAALVEGGGHA